MPPLQGSATHAVRFIHTGDWQLGMTRHYLGDEAQARFAQARFDVLRTLGERASRTGAAFVVACGDVFESNRVDRRTVRRALEALAHVSVPVYLLPGNHDPLEPGSVYRSATFLDQCPAHVHVLEDANPVEVVPGVELVGAPWRSKRPLEDTVAAACETLAPARGPLRILAAHGAVDAIAPQRREPSTISLASAQAALADRIHYLALGDRHSWTRVDDRIWYAGAPEPTDFDEEAPGYVLQVDLSADEVHVEPVHVGTWRFCRETFELAAEEDLHRLERTLDGLRDKACAVIELVLKGELGLELQTRLERALSVRGDLFGALRVSATRSQLRVRPRPEDFERLELEGFARAGFEHLRALEAGEPSPSGLIAGCDADPDTARDALRLLVRLCGAKA